MKHRRLLGLMLMMALAACGSTPSSVVPTATVAPAVNPTTAASTQLPTTTMPPAAAAAPATSAPTPTEAAPAQPTAAAPAPIDTIAATKAPIATRPRPTPTSSGPLAATIYVANCRSAPTADKPGRVMVQISVEASGGSGNYQYYYEDKASPTKFIEVVGERGTRAIGEVRVTSSDGQELKKRFDIGIGELTCP